MKALKLRTVLAAALFTVAPALLASVHNTLALATLPLLASLLAVRRGRSWAAFALLGGASCLAALGLSRVLAWPAALASGAAVLTYLAVLPHLWRFDRAATAILMASTILLGAGAGSLVSAERSRARADAMPSIDEPFREAVGGAALADFVGIYEGPHTSHGDAERWLILDASGGATYRHGELAQGGTYRATGPGQITVVLRLEELVLQRRGTGLFDSEGFRYHLQGEPQP